MRVKKLLETPNAGCRCGSWLQHWDNFSRQKANFCMVLGCDGKPEVGGLVCRETEPEQVCVVPLCRSCAAKVGTELDIVNTVNLVPVSLEDTCCRKEASAF
jgi:hypothetical protein